MNNYLPKKSICSKCRKKDYCPIRQWDKIRVECPYFKLDDTISKN